MSFDLSKTGGLCAAAEWIRKSGEALVVVVIRPTDAAFAADPLVPAEDAGELIARYLPQLVADLRAAHKEKRAAGRLDLGPLEE
jgi:hypothetical protein